MRSKGFFNLWLIIIVAAIGVAAILAYGIFNFAKIKKAVPGASPAAVDQEVSKLESLSSSDEIEVIEEDLKTTDIDNLDQELVEVEKEIPEL